MARHVRKPRKRETYRGVRRNHARRMRIEVGGKRWPIAHFMAQAPEGHRGEDLAHTVPRSVRRG